MKDNARDIENSSLDFKIYFMGRYLLFNLILTSILWIITISTYNQVYYLLGISTFFTFNLVIRTLASVIDSIAYRF